MTQLKRQKIVDVYVKGYIREDGCWCSQMPGVDKKWGREFAVERPPAI